MTEPARAGIVLAGGFSTRFEDGDKTLATLAGRPLLAHAIEGVAPAVDGVVVSCREAQLEEFRPIFERFEVPVAPAPDPKPDRGPAAGIANALQAVRAPWVAVVAGDMPFVDGDFLEWLFEQGAGTDGAVPKIGGYPQPTHAVYRREALEAAAAASTEDDGSLRAVIDRLDVTIVPEETVLSQTDRRTFIDVNTVAELESVREDFGDGGG